MLSVDSSTETDVTLLCRYLRVRQHAFDADQGQPYVVTEDVSGWRAWSWHFQGNEALIPWASHFGSQILRLRPRRTSDLQEQSALWSERKRLLHRGTKGWW